LPYSLDTSGLLDGWVRYYAPEVFPSLWKQMEAAAADGTIVAVQDVLLELERQDDDVFAWAKRPSSSGRASVAISPIHARHDFVVLDWAAFASGGATLFNFGTKPFVVVH